MAEEKGSYGSGYGKRPMWQWILLYLIIGGIVYGLIYYFVFAKNSGYSYGGSSNSGTMQNATSSGNNPYSY
jgi:hypothetical protein